MLNEDFLSCVKLRIHVSVKHDSCQCSFYVLENKFSSIGPIYYEHGSLVIRYEDSSKAVRAFYTLRESSYEDKHLLGKQL